MTYEQPYVIINKNDNAAVVITPMRAGDSLTADGRITSVKNDIPQGHKIALCDIAAGGRIIKYGSPIGYAARDIKAGEHIHTHNIKTTLNETAEYIYEPVKHPLPKRKKGTFLGFRRPNGKAGVRNEVWIIPTVGCVNETGRNIAAKAARSLAGSVTGCHCFGHTGGCSQLGDDFENTRRILKGLINHPNAGGVLVLGLGCETNSPRKFERYLGDYNKDRVKFLICQEHGDEITEGCDAVLELIYKAKDDKREEIPSSELIIGLKCGGTDGMSGITANPLIGMFSDYIISEGGSTVLTEVPEMFGAETVLMNRCADETVFGKTVRLINDFKEYYTSLGFTVYENPSPGNKAGGISTLEDKSLGCTQKAGSAPVVDVLDYGGSVVRRGLNLLQSPGNDSVAVTALAASGAHIILFSTGRGTPIGSPAPVIKISSNTELYNKKRNWIDFDAGRITDGASFKKLADELYADVIKTANGETVTKSEAQGCREIMLFRTGVTL